jgi:hypothetical protein
MEEDALLEKKTELKIFCLKRSFLTIAPQIFIFYLKKKQE